MSDFELTYSLVEVVLRPPVALWFNWRLEGLERIPRTGPILVAANHISYFDPIADGYLFIKAGRKPRFMAKQELFENPFMKIILNGAKQIPVTRGSRSMAPLQAAVDALHAGEVVLVYPEATITKNADSLPMKGKTGIARLALEAGIPVTPVAVWGSQHIWQKEGIGDLRFGRPISVKVGEPIDLSEYQSSKGEVHTLHEATSRIMDEIRKLVLELRAAYPRKWS